MHGFLSIIIMRRFGYQNRQGRIPFLSYLQNYFYLPKNGGKLEISGSYNGSRFGPSCTPVIITITAVIYTGAVIWKSKEPWCFLLFVSRRAQQLLTMTTLVMLLSTSFMSQN